jgi:hypothetical protein
MKLGTLVTMTALVAMGGCSSSSVGAPLGSSSPGGADSQVAMTCGDFYGYTILQYMPACAKCLEQSCCSEALACAPDSGNDCDALDRCLDACPSPVSQSCINQCEQQFPSGVGPADVWVQCQVDHCDQPCIQALLGDGGVDQ